MESIDVSITIGWVIQELRPAVERDIVGIDQVNRCDEAAHWLTCQQPVQFIDHLPAMQVERFGHRDRLVIFSCMRRNADALPSPADSRLMPSRGIPALLKAATE